MFPIVHKIGIDANQPLYGAQLSDVIANPETIVSTGAGWVRLNFVLEAATSPADDQWLRTYHAIIDQYRAQGLQIYGLIGAQAVKTTLGQKLQQPVTQTTGAALCAAQDWLAEYADNFGAIVQAFGAKVAYFESFNEPNNWAANQRPWLDPSWFAYLLQAVYQKVKVELALPQVKLISGPLLGHFHHQPEGKAAANYLAATYQTGIAAFGWGQAQQPFPFDGIGYHLYLKPDLTCDWPNHECTVRRYYANFMNSLFAVIQQHEGTDAARQLFISEIGWTSGQYTAEHLAFQAKNVALALSLVAEDPRVGLGIWFCAKDFVSGQNNEFYGLYRKDCPLATARKPAFAAFQQFCTNRFGPTSPLRFSNQEIINAIYIAAERCNQAGWTWVVRAGLEPLAISRQVRNAQYQGPNIELLPGLTSDEKARVNACLAERCAAPQLSATSARPPTARNGCPALLTGKGLYIWRVPQCAGGNSQTIAARAVAAGLTHVLIKVADGAQPYNIYPACGDLVAPLTAALRGAGVQVWGWQFVYGHHEKYDLQPEPQAVMAIERARQFDLDGFVVDAEGSFEGRPEAALRYMAALRAGLPDLPIALSSFRFVKYHTTFPWEEFLTYCDLHMPQVYWQKQDPVLALRESVAQHSQHQHARPLVPTGAAYYMEAGVPATPEQISAFLDAARQTSAIAGVNFWSWQHAEQAQLWSAIADFAW